MLTKSNNKKLFGVCGGLSEYFGLDPTIVRILFVLGTFLTGSLVFWIYLLLALVLPSREQ